MAKLEYVILAHVFDSKKHRVGGWFLSEKLDGTRAIWDGGISRGLPVEEVPYANTIKDKRFQEQQFATGLWSRSGKAIQAPDWWLDSLPKILLDGELWIGYGKFQQLRSTIASLTPGHNWGEVQYMVFDMPAAERFFLPRDIKIRNEYQFQVQDHAYKWAKGREVVAVDASTPFHSYHKQIQEYTNDVIQHVYQSKLQLHPGLALAEIQTEIDEIVKHGGEGVMLRWGSSFWEPERSHNLLKHKPINTDDGVVVGYTAGEGRLLGMVGALILDYKGKVLKLSGLTDSQREILIMVEEEPGQPIKNYSHHLFPLGTVVEFKYRELSDDGVPKEARFWRIKE